VFRGEPDAPDALAFCLRAGRLAAAVGFNCPKDVTEARRVITAGGHVDRARLADPAVPLAELDGAPD
jgi:3-phenylpropionate/trans-cinnamate dioxygenase ferredoxin reductase subunit